MTKSHRWYCDLPIPLIHLLTLDNSHTLHHMRSPNANHPHPSLSTFEPPNLFCSIKGLAVLCFQDLILVTPHVRPTMSLLHPLCLINHYISFQYTKDVSSRCD